MREGREREGGESEREVGEGGGGAQDPVWALHLQLVSVAEQLGLQDLQETRRVRGCVCVRLVCVCVRETSEIGRAHV